MSKKLLQVEHLSIALKNPYQDLVKDISFSLEEAGAVILLGQSGSGKTMTCPAPVLFPLAVKAICSQKGFRHSLGKRCC